MKPRVLIAGGYGLVGGWVARHLRAAGHEVELVLGGRNPESGEVLARETGAALIRLDTREPEAGLADAEPFDLVIATLQDPGDTLLCASLAAGAAHIGIVGMARGVTPTLMAIEAARAARPALVLGHWQAGGMVAGIGVAARTFGLADRIELSALYDYADPIGPMTANDAGGFAGQAMLRREGVWIEVDSAAEGREISRLGGQAFAAAPTGVLDIFSAAALTGAGDIRFDLGVGQSLGTLNGGPASHDLYIDLFHADARRRWRLSDPMGQAHLTALGVLAGAERLLGLDGAPAPKGGGLALPETHLDADRALKRFEHFGVSFGEESAP